MKRDKIIETIKDFPEEESLSDLFEKLIMAEKIASCSEQLGNGEIESHKEAIECLRKKIIFHLTVNEMLYAESKAEKRIIN